MGGNKIQGRTSGETAGTRERLLDDAHAVDSAGAVACVIEGVPQTLAREITDKITCPTIGIGAGVGCSGQVLVLHDLLGLSPRSFSFAKAYTNFREVAIAAVSEYVSEVKDGTWPDGAHSFD
jgi:3-methyl-2-oxobutanoate hydroxymethyltransferase